MECSVRFLASCKGCHAKAELANCDLTLKWQLKTLWVVGRA